ncbi:MAG: chaperonin GroEL [Clostridia bacterium]|nr:chaperonin GroEL [Clostridia bacterium]
MKQIMHGLEALEKLKIGANKLSNAVKITLGPKGRNVALDRKYTTPLITNDGVTIAKEISLECPFENMGANIIKEATVRANSEAGDGTTTACILSSAIVTEGFKAISSGYSPMLIRKGIEKATAEAVKILSELSKPVTSDEEIVQVASVSAGDKTIGKLIGDATKKVGTDGIITIEESSTSETFISLSQGYEYERGLASPYMATDTSKMQSILENPLIMIVNKKISSITEILPVLEQVMQTGKQLLIVADDIDPEVLGTLVVNRVNGTLPVTFTKAPAFAEKRRQMLLDMCLLTGANLVSDDTGLKAQNATLSDLGSAKTVIVTTEKTTIIEGCGNADKISAHVQSLKELLEHEKDDYKKDEIKSRISKLTSSAAIIHAGAASEVECKELKLRIEDALFATKAASSEGIVAGGGTTLLHISNLLTDFPETLESEEEKIGAKILLEAIKYPIKQIAENAGADAGKIVYVIESKNQFEFGYDALSDEFVNMFEAGIIDPAKVTRTALENASSVASTLLTTSVLVTDKENSEK